MDKKNFVLRDCGGDLSKRWFIEYKFENKWRRKYGDLNRCSTLTERLAAAARLIALLQKKPVKQKLRLLSEDWVEKNKFRWRLKSYQTIKSKIKTFFDWLGIRSLAPSVLLDFLQHLGALGRSRTTYNNYIRVLKMINSECWKIKDLFSEARALHAEPTPAKYFTREQITFLGGKFAALNPELCLAAQLQYYCFIRPGELRLLRVDDIEFEVGRILIRGEISKNRKEQYVAIPAAFVPALSAAVLGRAPSSYLFGASVPHRKDFFAKKHQKMLKELHFDTTRYKFYSWKHSGVVAAVRAGIHIKELQIQLRHHSLDQVNAYLRQLGVTDLQNLQDKFPAF